MKTISSQKIKVIQQRIVEVASLQFKVSANVPVPPKKTKGGGKWISLFRAMRCGECVTLPDQQAAGALAQAGYKDGGRISQRKTDNGVTCWRIE